MKKIDKNLLESVAALLSDKIKKQSELVLNNSNTEKYYNGVVVTVNSKTEVDVKLSFGMITVPNLSGEDLNKDDRVKVYSDKQNLSDAYIGVKY